MDLLNMYYAWGENFSGYTINAWMVNHLEVPVLVTIAYLFMVLYIPDNFMKQREAMSLRWLNILWNFILSAFSFVGAYYCIPELYHLIMHRQGSFNIYHGLCIWDAHGYWEGYSGAFVALFILSKIPEMIDTVFLVFQKKKIIFLHWYHHVTVMLYCWHAYSNRISSGLVFAAMNYGVHSIMYTYYLMCACGQRKLVRPFAPLITFLQIAQMVVGMIVEAYCLYHHYISQKGCATSATNARLGLMMYVSYFILFCQLFKQSYLSPKPARAVEAAKAGTDKPEKKKRA